MAVLVRWSSVLMAVASLLIVSTASSTSAQEKQLRWQFKAGEKLDYDMTQSMVMKMDLGGRKLETKMVQSIDMIWAVDEVDSKGIAQITQSIGRIKMSVGSPLGAGGFEYDSASDEEPTGAARVMVPVFKALLKAKIGVKMNPRGEVLDVKAPQDVIDAIKKVPGAAQFGQMFTKEGFEQMIRQGSPAFPEKAVSPDETWSTTMKMKNPALGGTQTVKTEYKYLGEESGLDKIGIKMTLDFGEGAGPMGAKIKVTDQKSDGVMKFDNKAGRIVESKLKQAMKMQLSIGDTTLDQQLEMDIDVKVKPAK